MFDLDTGDSVEPVGCCTVFIQKALVDINGLQTYTTECLCIGVNQYEPLSTSQYKGLEILKN
jgi:hypothetical protein